MCTIMNTFYSCSSDSASEEWTTEERDLVSRSIMPKCPEPILDVTIVPDEVRTCTHLLVKYLGTDQPESECMMTSIEMKVGSFTWDFNFAIPQYNWYGVNRWDFPSYIIVDASGFPVSLLDPLPKGGIIPILFPVYTGDGTSPNDQFEVLVRFEIDGWLPNHASVVCLQVTMTCPSGECADINAAGEYVVDICETIYHPCW
jgi:hypothetical protein